MRIILVFVKHIVHSINKSFNHDNDDYSKKNDVFYFFEHCGASSIALGSNLNIRYHKNLILNFLIIHSREYIKYNLKSCKINMMGKG